MQQRLEPNLLLRIDLMLKYDRKVSGLSSEEDTRSARTRRISSPQTRRRRDTRAPRQAEETLVGHAGYPARS